MQKIGITVRHSLSGALKGKFFDILQFLANEGKEVFLCPYTKKSVKKSLRFSSLPVIENFSDLDLFIFFGGDGTLLGSVNRFAPEILSIPIFGINAGNVGFFSSVTPDNIKEGLSDIFSGKFSLDTRMVLQGEIIGKNPKKFFALNECTIHHSGIARLRKIDTKVSDEDLTTFCADGLIISTPTGSTAYNLAAGGPIMASQMEGFILTPLAPAGFSQRPIVLPPQKRISFQPDGEMLISLDGQEYFPFHPHSTLIISKSQIPLTFLRLHNESYYSTLREKLGWG